MDNLIGSEIGPYKITDKLGRGGMADVYKAYHIDLEVNRAIKVIRPEFVTSEDFKARFLREAQAVAALRHPNIVQIHDFGSQDKTFYMVMEYIEGEDLKKTIKAHGPVRPISKALNIVIQIADALEYAHGRDVLHRDIKPENIMLNKDAVPILMDFGIAKLLTSDTQLTQTGVGIGTPSYMSPEQAQATDQVGPPSDIYSLAIVLYEMLTGRTPFSADTPIAVMLKAINDPLPLPRAICEDISEGLQQVLIKGAAKDPQRRYSTGLIFSTALKQQRDIDIDAKQSPAELDATVLIEHDVDSQIHSAEPDSAAKIGQKPNSRYFKTAGLLLLAVLGTIGGFYVWSLLNSPASNTPEIAAEGAGSVIDSAIIGSTVTAETDNAAVGNGVENDTPNQPSDKPAVSAISAAPQGKQQSQVVAEYRGSIAAGESQTVEIDIPESTVLYFNMIEASGTTDVTLTVSDGREALFSSYGNVGPITTKQPGKYTLTLVPRNAKEVEVDLQLWQLSPAVIQKGELSANEYNKGLTYAPGQLVRYQFSANAGDVLYLEVLDTTVTTDFSIITPDGRNKVIDSYDDVGPITLKHTGVYELLIDPRNAAVSEFDFGLFWLDPAVIEKGGIEFGRYYVGETTMPGQTARYQLDIEAGTTVYFEKNKTTATTDFSVVSADGRNVVLSSADDMGPVTIKKAGTYSVIVDPRSSYLSEFDFKFHKLDPAIVSGGVIEKGQTIVGETYFPGQLVEYTYAGVVGDMLELSVVSTSVTTDFILHEPDGRKKLFSLSGGKSGQIKLAKNGSYKMTVDPRNRSLAEFGFIVR